MCYVNIPDADISRRFDLRSYSDGLRGVGPLRSYDAGLVLGHWRRVYTKFAPYRLDSSGETVILGDGITQQFIEYVWRIEWSPDPNNHGYTSTNAIAQNIRADDEAISTLDATLNNTGALPVFNAVVPTQIDTSHFTLPTMPLNSQSLFVFKDRGIMVSGTSTFAGTTITLTVPLAPSQVLYATYIQNSSSIVSGFQQVPTGVVDGTNASFSIGVTPIDKVSTNVYVNRGLVPEDQYDLVLSSGSATIVFHTGHVPHVGQSVYVTGFFDVAMIGAYGPPAIFGTRSAPISITASGGIPFNSKSYSNTIFVQSSGGAVVLTGSPKITLPGLYVGQEYRIVFCSGTNTLQLDSGTGVVLAGTFVGDVPDRKLLVFWDGTNWTEEYRR